MKSYTYFTIESAVTAVELRLVRRVRKGILAKCFNWSGELSTLSTNSHPLHHPAQL